MKTILIVDDNKLNLVAAKMSLASDYKVVAVASGEQALAFLETNPCDLVLTDIEMPEMDGFELLKEIRQMDLNPALPVVFLTASADPETLIRCMEEGAVEIVEKPFVKQVLLNRVNHLMELMDYRTGKK